jgi:hypothetical protein
VVRHQRGVALLRLRFELLAELVLLVLPDELLGAEEVLARPVGEELVREARGDAGLAFEQGVVGGLGGAGGVDVRGGVVAPADRLVRFGLEVVERVVRGRGGLGFRLRLLSAGEALLGVPVRLPRLAGEGGVVEVAAVAAAGLLAPRLVLVGLLNGRGRLGGGLLVLLLVVDVAHPVPFSGGSGGLSTLWRVAATQAWWRTCASLIESALRRRESAASRLVSRSMA